MLTIYKASAGSGKTYNLAKYYIKFLLGIKDKDREARAKTEAERLDVWQLNLDRERQALKINNRHRAILAITFTRKATEEMKQRIVAQLSALARMPKPDEKDAEYADALMADLHCSRADLKLAAQISLQQLLFDYQNFHVSTIDSFFQRVLHTFAREIDIQTDYQVELNDKQAMQTAVGEMLDDFNTADRLDPDIKKAQLGLWLYDYMRSLIYEGKKADFLNRDSYAHSNLVDLVAQISKESFKPYKDAMGAYLESDRLELFAQTIRKYQDGIIDAIKTDAQATVTDTEIEALGKLRSKKPQTIVRDYLLRGRPVRNMDTWTDTQAMLDLIAPGTDVASVPPDVKAMIERSYARHCVYYTIESISAALTQLGLLRHAWGYLNKLMQDNNLVLISDTNELLKKVIGSDETPFVYERMGLQLVHHLIDEFQDTSTMQWANLLPLVSIGINDRDDSLIIGDEKQSIYRFRNSDSSILHHQLDEQFATDQIEHKGAEPKENTNYRSSPDVVRFNNSLFSLMARELGVDGYENVAQGINETHPGHVKFITTRPKSRGSGEDSEAKVLEEMTAEIVRMTGEGKYDYKDIAVLVDTNRQCAKAVDHLVEAGIPVLSDEALFLYKSWAVQLVINTLKIIDREQSGDTRRPEAADIRMRATNAQMHNVISQYELFIKDGASTPSEALDRAMLSLDAVPDAEVGASIERIMAHRPSSLAALIETVIEEQIPDPAARLAHSAYLSALQDAAILFASKNRGKGAASLHAFLDWWDANPRLAIGGASEADAVKVMTIHKSKGLEFPCVLIPFCKWHTAWKDGPRTPTIWTNALKTNIDVLNSAAEKAGLKPLDISNAPDALYVRLDKRVRMATSPFLADFNREWGLAIADTLNKTYVAFTRAKSELIVWCEVPKGNGKTKTKPKPDAGVIGVPISMACSAGSPAGVPEDLCLDLSAHKGDEPEILVEIGQPTVKKLSAKEIKELEEKAERDRLAITVGYDVEMRPDAVSFTSIIEEQDEAGAEVIDKEPKPKPHSKIQDEGTLLHEIMANVVHASDLPHAVRLVTRRHHVDPAKAAEYEQMLASLLADERTKSWFDGFERVYIEQPIYIPGAKEDIRRPDRVVVYADGSVDLLDYKFGEADPHPETYYWRVRQYMRLLRSIGHDRVRAFLLYPRTGLIHPVPPKP
ncbi:MAG: UvrD-helicase domain-containing protein [Muribaculaceae bacterium]|nr:UvrD-helicase domain-containing protein [Muribaculaceae bacterium]